MTVIYTEAIYNQSFNFVLASRRDNEVQLNFKHHLSRFLELKQMHKTR